MLRYFIDIFGTLWKGPITPENGTMYYSRFGKSFDPKGNPIWILLRGEYPKNYVEVSKEQAEIFISEARNA